MARTAAHPMTIALALMAWLMSWASNVKKGDFNDRTLIWRKETLTTESEWDSARLGNKSQFGKTYLPSCLSQKSRAKSISTWIVLRKPNNCAWEKLFLSRCTSEHRPNRPDPTNKSWDLLAGAVPTGTGNILLSCPLGIHWAANPDSGHA